MLSIDALNTRSRGKAAFTNFHFRFGDGEQWALVGDSDSGAAALIRIIAEKIGVHGSCVSWTPATDAASIGRNRIAAYVPQHFRFRHLSNTSTIYFQQRFNLAGDEDADTVLEFLQATGSVHPPGYWSLQSVIDRMKLRPLLDKQMFLLSNGETKRVLIAAALIRNPMVLLLDHPLTGLDVDTRDDIRQLIRDEVAAGVQVMMATEADDIPGFITHVAVFEHHEVKETSPAGEFIRDNHQITKSKAPDASVLASLLAPEHSGFQTVIGMSNVHVQYGDKVILDGVNWTVRQGERWALLGHNGAGKSTLLSLITGDNPQAYANDIILFDQKKGGGESIWSIKARIGYVSPELYRYFPYSDRCLDVVISGLRDNTVARWSPDEKQKSACHRWMAVFGIGHVADDRFDQVPASVQRLCLLARALVKDPVLLIMDEPCEGLDAAQQAHFVSVIDAICERSDVTLVYVSHYAAQIPKAVTKRLTLADGRVIDNNAV